MMVMMMISNQWFVIVVHVVADVVADVSIE